MSKKTKVMDPKCIYRFCGNGQGIPGLPHEVTKEQAKELGLLEHLTAALQRGLYKPVTAVSVADKTGENLTSTTRIVETAGGGSKPPRHEGE